MITIIQKNMASQLGNVYRVEWWHGLRQFIQKDGISNFAEWRWSGKTHYIAESDKGKFLSRDRINEPGARLGMHVIQTQDINKSPRCYYNDSSCKHHGSEYCVENTHYFCSWRHLENYMDSITR